MGIENIENLTGDENVVPLKDGQPVDDPSNPPSEAHQVTDAPEPQQVTPAQPTTSPDVQITEDPGPAPEGNNSPNDVLGDE